jgi:type IV pilus assembly protein PilC
MGIGERVGHVEKVFGQLRAYYQQEVEKWIHRLMTLIEPALIVVLGLLIILFVVFFIVPIFSLYGNVL